MKPVKRTALNLLIDVLAAAFFGAMIATGYVLRFPLPPGTQKSLSLWGLTRHEWGAVHFWISVGLLIVLLIHLTIHWQWIVTVIGKRFDWAPEVGGHLRSGVLTLLALSLAFFAFAWAARRSVRERGNAGCPPGDQVADRRAAPSDRPPTAVERARGDFWRDVYAILEASCLRCHGPDGARGGFRIDRRSAYFGNGGQPLVIPGKSAESPLIAIVSGRRSDMPLLAVHQLPEAEIEVLRNWIDAGAEWPDEPAQSH